MIKVKCDMCGKELDEQGAVVFGPPFLYDENREVSFSLKLHVGFSCCWSKLYNFIKGV